MPHVRDLSGNTFGHLTVIERSGTSRHGKTTWLCVCDCGNQIVAVGGNLTSGGSKSCGRGVHHPHTIHGRTNSRLYQIWEGMIQRCTNPRDTAYAHYGARGIAVCPRWRHFENFLADMGEAPAGRWIDRIDNDDGYRPGNCRWATPYEQQHNTRMNRRNKSGETCIRASGFGTWNVNVKRGGKVLPVRAFRTMERAVSYRDGLIHTYEAAHPELTPNR